MYVCTYVFFREKERQGEKHQCVVASHAPPAGVLARNPGPCRTGSSTAPLQPGLYSNFNFSSDFRKDKTSVICYVKVTLHIPENLYGRYLDRSVLPRALLQSQVLLWCRRPHKSRTEFTQTTTSSRTQQRILILEAYFRTNFLFYLFR